MQLKSCTILLLCVLLLKELVKQLIGAAQSLLLEIAIAQKQGNEVFGRLLLFYTEWDQIVEVQRGSFPEKGTTT